MRWRWISSALALCALAFGSLACGSDDGAPGAAATGAAGPGLRLGVVANTVGWGPQVGHQQNLVTALGVGWIREEFYWSQIAPHKAQRQWATYDRLMSTAARRGLRVLPLLNDAPAWAGGRDGALPTDTAGYAAFVRDIVRRYGTGGTFWKAHPALDAGLAPTWFELWNEPYFARPVESIIDARRYAELADAGLRAGHDANPDARMLISLETRTRARSSLDATWLDHVLNARPTLLRDADGIAAHPYDTTAAAALDALRGLRAELQTRGSDRPIWVTEVGWSTCGGASGCVSEGQQAADISQFLRAAADERLADAVFVYHLLSWRAAAGSNGGGFGLLRPDRSHKLSWTVVHRTALVLSSAAPG